MLVFRYRVVTSQSTIKIPGVLSFDNSRKICAVVSRSSIKKINVLELVEISMFYTVRQQF